MPEAITALPDLSFVVNVDIFGVDHVIIAGSGSSCTTGSTTGGRLSTGVGGIVRPGTTGGLLLVECLRHPVRDSGEILELGAELCAFVRFHDLFSLGDDRLHL